MPAGVLDRLAHGGEIAVEHEHHVVRQLLLGELRERAEIGEQDRDLALLALQMRGPRVGIARRRRRRQQRNDRDVGGRARLAGEADVDRASDALEHAGLGRARRRQVVDALADAHPAGRAPPAPAAHRGVRDAARPADLEDGSAGQRRDGASARVGHANGAAPSLDDGTRDTRTQRQYDHGTDRDLRLDDQGQQLGHLGPIGPLDDGVGGAAPFRILGQLDHVAPGLGVAQKREHRDQKRGAIEHGRGFRIERFEPEPEMDADTAVDPGDDQPRHLLPDIAVVEDPVDQQHIGVGVVDAGDRVRGLGADDVADQQERDGESHDQLRRLAPRND